MAGEADSGMAPEERLEPLPPGQGCVLDVLPNDLLRGVLEKVWEAQEASPLKHWVFDSERIFTSECLGVPAQLAALQARQLRAAEALALVCRRMHAVLRARPLPLQLSFQVPLHAAALRALPSPELAGRVEALHLWGWDAPLSQPAQEQLLGVLRNQAGSLQRLALEGHPAALLGQPGVDLRCLRQLTKLEVFAAEALQLVLATMPQGLARMVCTMDAEMGAGQHITWAVDDASAPHGCLPLLDWMHLRTRGRFSMNAEYARPGMHVHLSICPCSNGEYKIDHAFTVDGLQKRYNEDCSIFYTARSIFISGFSMEMAFSLVQNGPLTQALGLIIAYQNGELKLNMRSCQLEDANGSYNPLPVSFMARSLRNVIPACETNFAFELTGTTTNQPVLAWRLWPRAGTREFDVARTAHAQTRDWAWRH